MGVDGRLQSITDLNQNRLTFTADGISSSAGGMHVSVQRDAQGRITSITDPAGQSYGYGYDAAGDLRSVTLPGVATSTTYSYETQWPHLIHAIQDARGNSAATASYYPDGRLQSETTAVGDTTSYAYDLVHRVTTTTNPDLGVETRTYDSSGKLLEERDALNHTTVFTYDTKHQLLTRTNALGHTASYTYDARGNQTSVTNGALGTTSTTTYTQYGGPTRITSMIGITQTISYDAAFMPQEIRDAQGRRASFSFDAHGSMLSSTNGAG